MANKYLLIPEELYRGLTEVEPEDINLDFEKKQLEKSKKHPKKDRTAKNAIYQQELNRYLKLKRQQLNKPVKVELSNGAKLLAHAKNLPTPQPNPPAAAPPPQVNPQQTPGAPPAATPQQHHSAPPKFDPDYAQLWKRSPRRQYKFATGHPQGQSPLNSTQQSSSGLSVANLSQQPWEDDQFLFLRDDEDDEGEPQTFNFNQQQYMPTPRSSRVTVTDNPRRDELYNLITINPHKFNATSMGKILNNKGIPIQSSDILLSISRLLSPKVGESSPKGTKNLEAAKLRDPEARKIYEEAKQIKWDEKYNKKAAPYKFSAEKW
jgi:hypothetical protein